MNVKDAIETRRAYRSLEPVEITEEIIVELSRAAQLAPSCFNYQPWRYVFVYDPNTLEKMQNAISKANAWTKASSMIIAVFSKPELDCRIKEREYYLFDTGMSAAFIILRATELGLVAHPIAGYDPGKVREALNIPEEMNVIALVCVGKHSDVTSPLLTEKQAEIEKNRPERMHLEKIVFQNRYEETSDLAKK